MMIMAMGARMLAADSSSAITSIDTGYTIMKVRTAVRGDQTCIVGSSYEGTVLALGDDGTRLWENALSGTMNHDLWCGDITGDGNDETLAANADGSVYCLDSGGRLLWTFRQNDAPMNAVCTVSKDGVPYVVCGSYDTCMYYVSAEGELIKTVDSRRYSLERPWGKNRIHLPEYYRHVANFIRPFTRADGTEALAVHAAIWSTSAAGRLYLFEPLAEKPYKQTARIRDSFGELRVADLNGDGNQEFLAGSTSMIQKAHVSALTTAGEHHKLELAQVGRTIDWFGYRVAQPELVRDGKEQRLFVLFGARVILLPTDLSTADPKKAEVLAGRYSYNDMWKSKGRNRIILASAQSGGSCVHLIDLDNPGWKADYAALQPPGKIATILENSAATRERLESFAKPSWEKAVPPVYFMSESRKHGADKLIEAIETQYDSPVFFTGRPSYTVEKVDRTGFDPVYEKKRDGRMLKRYLWTSDEFVENFEPVIKESNGVAYWGGHGNDPFLTSLRTQKRLFDIAAAHDKKLVTIYPELEAHDEHFAWVMENHIYPMAGHAQLTGASIFVRTKHAFWNGIVYLPMWSRLVSGEFADVFVPALEETTDKSMELSVASRVGLWSSGSVNQWGARCARDNTSFDRTRQHSHQMLPNHFLRQMVYNISCGATYLNNFPVDQPYMSLLWELVAKGAIYVPSRNELVSLSPVHLSMIEPDARFLDTGNNIKWMTFYIQQDEDANPLVFNRLNGTWPGAPNTEWDFSRYAAGVKDRRLNYLPPYEHGLVMITPPQHGTFADPDAPRGKLADHLHPLYRNILKEYISDGRKYFSADGSETFAANTYHETIKTDIEAGATKLPLSVSGGVAWVCAQTAPKHLRLTLIDSGYVNPTAKTATVAFHMVTPAKMTDLLSKETISPANPQQVTVPVSCGMFRFIDIELEEAL